MNPVSSPEELRVWILLGVVCFLWVVLTALIGVLVALGKSFVKRVLEKFDILIKEIQELKNKDTGMQKDIETLKENQNKYELRINEINEKFEKHGKCRNFKPIG